MKNKKQILIIASAAVLIIFIACYLMNHFQEKSRVKYLLEHYIFDKDFHLDNSNRNSSGDSYFSQGIVTGNALKLFKLLENKYPVQSINERGNHYNQVRQYLSSQFKEAEAARLFEVYRKYLECEIQLANDPQYRTNTSDPRQHLVLLNNAHNFRRDKMGIQTADALFGRDVKEREYLLRQAMIINDNNLYGKEKENRLQKLKADMWADKAQMPKDDLNPYNRYQLKMQLYQNDLAILDESRRQLKIGEFRKEFFSEEQIKRLCEVDQQIARENKNMERYRSDEQKILALKDITQEEKNKRIKSLQDKLFGKEADALRRREAMRKGAEK